MKIKAIFLAAMLFPGTVLADNKQAPNPVTEAGAVKITWQSPDKYTDIKSSGELQSRYEQRAFESMTKQLNKLADKVLTNGEKLELTVTNVDLAGDVRPTFGAGPNDIRVLKDIYPPRIAFSYRLIKGDKVVLSGEEKLKDMNYLGGIQPLRQESFMYENQMLKQWFNRTFAPQLEGHPPK